MKLTDKDHSTLEHAAYLRRKFDAGIFPTGAGQHSHFRRLARLGLLVFDGWGRDIDGEVEQDVMLYKLTEAGEQAAGDVAGHAGRKG